MILLAAEGGGVCALVNTSCSACTNKEKGRNEYTSNLGKEKPLHQVAQDDTSFGFMDIRSKLTSWLPNFTCIMVILIILVVLTCILVQCSLVRLGKA